MRRAEKVNGSGLFGDVCKHGTCLCECLLFLAVAIWRDRERGGSLVTCVLYRSIRSDIRPYIFDNKATIAVPDEN